MADVSANISRAMKKSTYPTAQDAEAAFYEALERADLEAMMEVWADDEEVACIHPGGPRLAGFEQVRQSWALMFKSGQRLRVQLSDQIVAAGMMFAIHSLHENILAEGGGQVARSVVVTTNVYMRSGGGWRMVLHHGSPAVAARGGGSGSGPTPEPPKVVH